MGVNLNFVSHFAYLLIGFVSIFVGGKASILNRIGHIVYLLFEFVSIFARMEILALTSGMFSSFLFLP